MTPLVSIIIPCYNHGCYLAEALESVQQQTYPYWECVVVNDASQDDTIAVTQRFLVQDDRFRLLNKPHNEGLAAARNSGIAATTGPYILPLDADDKIAPTYLEEGVAILNRYKQVNIVYSNVYQFGNLNTLVERPNFNIKMLAVQNQFHCSAIYRRSSFNKTEGYRTNMIYGYEDWDLWLQMIKKNADCYKIPKPLVYLRSKADSMYLQLTEHAQKELAMRALLRTNNPDFFKKHAKGKTIFQKIIDRIIP